MSAAIYWARVWQRICDDVRRNAVAHKRELIATLVLPLLIGAPIHYWIRGYGAMMGELEIIATYVLAPFGMICLLFFLWTCIAAPDRLAAEMDTSIAAKDEQIRILQVQDAGLEFTWRHNDIKYLEAQTVRRKGQSLQGRVGRVAVKNMSAETSICGVTASLVNYKKDTGGNYYTMDKTLAVCRTLG